MSTLVFCSTRFIGFHCWPNAPDNVKYLRELHRHEFHVKVSCRVLHKDRDVEFITLKENTDTVIKNLKTNWPKTFSCEMMAGEIAVQLKNTYAYNIDSVEVSEDGENGAVVAYE